MKAAVDPRETEILREIGELFERVRELRQPAGRLDGAQIKAIEAQSRVKWEELRLLRAGPVAEDHSSPRRRGLYI